MMQWLRRILGLRDHRDIESTQELHLALRVATDSAARSREITRAYRREDTTQPRPAG